MSDVIVSVNGVDIAGRDLDGVLVLLAGPAGEEISLELERATERLSRDLALR